MGAFKSLTMLPSLSGRRFTKLELGSMNVDVVRTEFATLLAVAAVVVGVPVEELTTEQVAAIDMDALRIKMGWTGTA